MEILTTTWVVPVDGPPLRDGRVAVEEGRVAWVGAGSDPRCPSGPLRSLGPGVLLPGLVNAHCHLELSHLAGELPLGDFVSWVEALVALRSRLPAAEVQRHTAAAIRFLEERGTVAVGDVSNALAHLDLLGESRLEAVVFLEVLAWDPDRADAALAGALERLESGSRGLGPNVRLRLAAHAPHSVSPPLLRALSERGLAALHLAESPEEARFLAEGGGPWGTFLERRGLGHVRFEAPGTTPVRYVDGLGALRPGLLAVHCVQTGVGDRELLAQRGVGVVVCPRSNRSLGVGSADVPALLAAGVPLALGTDSLASVETLDVLEDAAFLARQFPGLDRAAIVRMATAGGAEALGLDDLGTIAPGKRAALVFAAASEPPRDPHAFVLGEGTTLRRVEVS
jgi:cytosine/adenosine deaminase-related metal-dependent hydrolase